MTRAVSRTVRVVTRRALRMDANRRSGLDRTVAAPAGRGGVAMPRAASVHSAGQGQKHHNIGLTPYVRSGLFGGVVWSRLWK